MASNMRLFLTICFDAMPETGITGVNLPQDSGKNTTLPAHLRNDVFTLPFGIFRRGTEKGEEVWQNHF